MINRSNLISAMMLKSACIYNTATNKLNKLAKQLSCDLVTAKGCVNVQPGVISELCSNFVELIKSMRL